MRKAEPHPQKVARLEFHSPNWVIYTRGALQVRLRSIVHLGPQPTLLKTPAYRRCAHPHATRASASKVLKTAKTPLALGAKEALTNTTYMSKTFQKQQMTGMPRHAEGKIEGRLHDASSRP